MNNITMKNIIYIVFMLIMIIMVVFIVSSCEKKIEIQMSTYTPKPISYLNGKIFAILSPWKKDPSRGSYLVLYDLDKLKVAETIPLPGKSAYINTVYYWNGKYVFLSEATEEIGILDAKTGKIKMIPVAQSGLGLGITKAGIFYLVADAYDLEKGSGISIIDVNKEKLKRVYWYKEGSLWMLCTTNCTNYTYPATNAYCITEDVSGDKNTKLLRFVPGKTEPELVFDFGTPINANRGMSSEDEKYFYMPVYKGYMINGKPEWANKPRLVVVNIREKKMKLVDIPLKKLFGVQNLDDYGTGWCSTWNGCAYITPYYSYKGYDGTALIKYDPSTGRFTKITPTIEGGICGLSIIDNKAVLIRSTYPSDVVITVVDLKNKKVLVNDVDISQHN
jgi:hypothetical protein